MIVYRSVDEWSYLSRFGLDPSSIVNPDGLEIPRVFSRPDVHPFEEIEWTRAPVVVRDARTQAVLFSESFEAPAGWSDTARQIVCTKFAYGKEGVTYREKSARCVVGRVCLRIARWGDEQGYFKTHGDAATYCDELTWLIINQHFSFNSPVWFNVGHDLFDNRRPSPADNWINRIFIGDVGTDEEWHVARNDNIHEHPQVHACFIQSVEDSIEGIMSLATAEAIVFKYGSGTGSDLSPIRSKRERLNGGGTPSGPVSFMKIFDAVAGVVKSGGKSRRAAKMQTLKCWHPDIFEFVDAKGREDDKARALIAAGYPADFNGEAYSSVAFQNCNMSVRITDEFLEYAADGDHGPYPLRAVTTGEVIDGIDAGELLDAIATGAHRCGDPAVQFEDTIRRWHTTPVAGPINSSNPCGEFMSIDESACNLASHRLTRFVGPDGRIDLDRYRAAIDLAIIGMDIIIDPASYPTAKIAENVRRFRQLGLGYADLGSLVMGMGLPYDSDDGREMCAALTSYMTARAYAMSATLAKHRGPFDGFAADRENMLHVIDMHHEENSDRYISSKGDSIAESIFSAANRLWSDALELGNEHGYRNSQVTLLAPTGTIGYMMDCDTLGIEPDMALVKHKRLAGGGDMRIVNRSVASALDRLGYDRTAQELILDHIEEHNCVTTAGPGAFNSAIRPEHVAVFDCAIPSAPGRRVIAPMGHVMMMAAAQPFLSGAISKTVNLPAETTVERIKEIFLSAHKLGLKSITVYRDGSKDSQPVTTSALAPERNGATIAGGVPFHVKVAEMPGGRDLIVDRLLHERHTLLAAVDVEHKSDVPISQENLNVAIDRIVIWKQNESYLNVYGKIVRSLADASGVAFSPGVTFSPGDTLARNGERLIDAVRALKKWYDMAPKYRVGPDDAVSGLASIIKELYGVFDIIYEKCGIDENVDIEDIPDILGRLASRASSAVPVRHRLPQTRAAINHHFEIAGTHGNFDGYISVGRYEDGKIGEIFMASGKGGSTLDGMLKVIGTLTSLLLQYGVPFEVLARKFSNVRFEPNGPTKTEEVRFAKSIIDYIFRWVALNFSPELKLEWTPRVDSPGVVIATDRDVPAEGNSCPECGDSNLRHEGNCWRCPACFWISGGCGG
jgi:ribonucleoside-diphosphate reductase alpha chain